MHNDTKKYVLITRVFNCDSSDEKSKPSQETFIKEASFEFDTSVDLFAHLNKTARMNDIHVFDDQGWNYWVVNDLTVVFKIQRISIETVMTKPKNLKKNLLK